MVGILNLGFGDKTGNSGIRARLMAPQSGTRLGQFEIVGPLGKVLPEALSESAGHLARSRTNETSS